MEIARYPDLAGRVALVTGSSKALGAETARRFAAEGARVVIHGRNAEAVEVVASEIRNRGGQCVGLTADVTSSDDLASLRASIRDSVGEVDILAAFAGGLGNPVPVLELTEEMWRNTINSDLTSKFLTVRTFAPSMKEKRFGNIILMSSTAGRFVSQASPAYGAAQAGTLMLMRHLAQELTPFGIRVNAIAPSIVRNEKIEKYMSREEQAKVAQWLPLRRIGEPTDVAEAALFLACEASSWITGQCLDVNGGKVMI